MAVLVFLSTWLANCSLAVQTFLSVQNSVSYVCTDKKQNENQLFSIDCLFSLVNLTNIYSIDK